MGYVGISESCERNFFIVKMEDFREYCIISIGYILENHCLIHPNLPLMPKGLFGQYVLLNNKL